MNKLFLYFNFNIFFLGDYKEIPDIPAYKDDNRFELIKFPWISNLDWNKEKKGTSCYEDKIIEDIQSKLKDLEKGKKVLLNKGTLSSKDLFCLKSVKEFGDKVQTFDSLVTLYWFSEFLVRQDLQANYKFLKSCLVKDLTCDLPAKNDCDPNFDDSLYKLDIIIK